MIERIEKNELTGWAKQKEVTFNLEMKDDGLGNYELERKRYVEHQREMLGFCIWKIGNNGEFKTSCQKDYFFTDDFNSTSMPDKFRFCPYCGRFIEER